MITGQVQLRVGRKNEHECFRSENFLCLSTRLFRRGLCGWEYEVPEILSVAVTVSGVVLPKSSHTLRPLVIYCSSPTEFYNHS